MSKITSEKGKNTLLKAKSHQILRVASQQSLHLKSIQKNHTLNNYEMQVPLKIKRSLHNNNNSNPRKRSPLSTHKNKNNSSKRSPKIDLGIDLKKKSKNATFKTVQNLASKNLKVKQQTFDLPSFRQYCVVDSVFVPLASSDQKRLFSGLMANTISTCDPQLWASRQKKQCQNLSDANDQIDIFVPIKQAKKENLQTSFHFRSQSNNKNSLHNKDRAVYLSNKNFNGTQYCCRKQQEQCKQVYCQTEYYLLNKNMASSKLLDAQTQYSNRKIFDQQKCVQETEMTKQQFVKEQLTQTQINQDENRNLSDLSDQKQIAKNSSQYTVSFLKKKTSESVDQTKWKLRDNQRFSIEPRTIKKQCGYQMKGDSKQIRRQQIRRQQTLEQILLKLQFLHLPDKNCFEDMSKVEREHYSSLFQSLLSKLNHIEKHNQSSSERSESDEIQQKQTQNKCKAGASMRQQCSHMQRERVEIQGNKLIQCGIYKCSGQDDEQNEGSVQYQKVRVWDMMNFQVELRQIRQLNLALTSNTNCSFSLLGIANELTSLLTFLQLNFSQQILQILNRVYGYSYKDRLRCITKRHQNQLFNFKMLLPSQIYTQYLQQTIAFQETGRQAELEVRCIYTHALFDCINEQLDPYRAFFTSQGQPYPWSMKIIKSITYFTIDEQSIEIVFSQIKQKILGYVSVLCGLLVDTQYFSILSLPQNPITNKRNEAQARVAQHWVNSIDFIPDLQNSSTQTLLRISELVFEDLIKQLTYQVYKTQTNDQRSATQQRFVSIIN